MDPTNTSSQTMVLDEEQKKEYEQFGREEAQKSQGDPGQLKERLPFIYSRFKENAKKDHLAIANQKLALENDLIRLKEDLNIKKASIQTSERQILEFEKEKISGNIHPNDESLSFYIGAFITILLTLYLYAFYAASGYAAFQKIGHEVKDFSGIFISLEKGINRGGFGMVFTFLFPTIFIGLGFLLNDGLQKKKYGILAFLLVFTLTFDFIIGYEITHKIYLNAYDAGLTEIPWNKSMVFYDINFYIVLASGFVCYIMWGFLLNYTLNKFQEIQPGAQTKLHDRQIKDLHEKNNHEKALVLSTEAAINDKEKVYNDIMSGQHFEINTHRFIASLGVFMGGWCEWIQLMRRDEAAELIPRSQQAKEEWLENKLKEREGRVT